MHIGVLRYYYISTIKYFFKRKQILTITPLPAEMFWFYLSHQHVSSESTYMHETNQVVMLLWLHASETRDISVQYQICLDS